MTSRSAADGFWPVSCIYLKVKIKFLCFTFINYPVLKYEGTVLKYYQELKESNDLIIIKSHLADQRSENISRNLNQSVAFMRVRIKYRVGRIIARSSTRLQTSFNWEFIFDTT